MKNQKGAASIWIILILILLLLIFGAGFYYYNSNKKEAESGSEPEPTLTEKPTPISPYDGWNTYKNTEVGYQLKYPTDWTIETNEEDCKQIDPNAKSIYIHSPNDTYIHFGIKKQNQGFNITCRTGIGAGEDKAVENKATKLLGAKIIPYAHIFEGKTTEYFYKFAEGEEEEKCDCEIAIWFSATYNTYDGNEMPDDDIDTVNLILASVEWLPKTVTTPTSDSLNQSGSQAKIKEAKKVAGKFLQARIHRNLIEAKPYVTESFYNSTNPADFAGTSSPSMGKYKIKSVKYLSAADIYRVKAIVYWYLQGELSGTSIWTLDCVEEDGKILVNKVEGGY